MLLSKFTNQNCPIYGETPYDEVQNFSIDFISKWYGETRYPLIRPFREEQAGFEIHQNLPCEVFVAFTCTQQNHSFIVQIVLVGDIHGMLFTSMLSN